jgi:hypothetical protein
VTRQRLLFLLPHVPGPEAPTGGARSTFHLIAGLSKRYEVAALCLRSASEPPTDEALYRVCSIVQEVARQTTHGRGLRRRVQRRLLPLLATPAWVLSTDIPAYRQRLRALVQGWKPDIVHI